MVSLRSLLGPSTAALRQFLPRHNSTLRALSRPFSQLSQLTINNGLSFLRSKSVMPGVGASAVRQVEQVRGMKTRSSVKRLCEGCKRVVLEGIRLMGAFGNIACAEKEPGLHYLLEEPETQAASREIGAGGDGRERKEDTHRFDHEMRASLGIPCESEDSTITMKPPGYHLRLPS
ncbi:uncharacterized protein DSM5745_01213 [Aspergillus mulundensis]|uniref:Uncharacterized protein n=1 Tax=Aspergillus mulundensis TaxID=1810919 RepID=A0A3D8T627_9EURO|nr:hypothetical protein DSM5745_01213 [Aspergillus mulundensis]RDW93891.1 hypothetical protein DSM5745_01213 [Aspergillus mulundensis]